MDSPTVVLEDSSGFLIYSTRVETFPSCAAYAASDFEFEDSTVVLLLNFGGIL